MIVSHQLAQDEGNYVGGFAVVEYSTAEHEEEHQQAGLMEWPSGKQFKLLCAPEH